MRIGRGTPRRSSALVLLAFAGAACTGAAAPTELVGYTLDPTPAVGDLSLPEATAGGAPFSLRADAGGLLITFFGYTRCPDICPLTMTEVRRALEHLDDDEAAAVDVAMVTVDPDRDTPEILAGYVQGFVVGGHGLRADDPDELAAVADRFGAGYAVTSGPGGEIEVTHTGSVFVVDADGAVAVVWPFGTRSEDMHDDLSLLLAVEAT